MAKGRIVQTSFSAGRLDRNFEARIDLETYAKGARTIDNCYIDNIGRAFRREGTEYIDNTVTDQAARIISFEFNNEQTYLLEFTPGSMRVFTDDTVTATVTTSPISTLTADMIAQMDFTQSADTLILVHEDLQPIKITRTSDSSWTATSLSIDNIPQFSFFDTSGSGTDEVMRLSLNIGTTNRGSFRFNLEGELSDYIYLLNADTGAQRATKIQTALRNMARTSATGITVSSVSADLFDITFAGDDGERDWAVPSIESQTGFDAIAIASTTQGGPAEEDVWSSSRGWPRTVTFFEGSLWFGGSKSRPQTVWRSVIGSFFDFNVGTGLDDEAIDITIDDDEVNAITAIFPGRTLQIFTTGGEFAILKTNAADPVTPSNITITKQTLHGAKEYVYPVSVDGSTLFIETGGQVLREFVFSDVELSYTANNVNAFSTEIFNDVTHMAIRGSTTGAPASYVYFVNADGSMAILNRLREQNLTAFTRFTTDGEYEDVAVVNRDVYVVVKRNIDGSDVRFIEKMNADHQLDASIITTSGSDTDTFTGYGHLNGEECNAFSAFDAGGLTVSVENVTPAAGSVTIAEEYKQLEVGLLFLARVELLPLEGQVAPGLQTFGDFKRLIQTHIRVENTRFLTVEANGQTFKPAFNNFGSQLLDQATPLFSGTLRVYLAGIARNNTMVLTQDKGFEFEVLGIMTEFKV